MLLARSQALFQQGQGGGGEDEDVIEKPGNQVGEDHPDQGKDGQEEHQRPGYEVGFEMKIVVVGYLTFLFDVFSRRTVPSVNGFYLTAETGRKHQ